MRKWSRKEVYRTIQPRLMGFFRTLLGGSVLHGGCHIQIFPEKPADTPSPQSAPSGSVREMPPLDNPVPKCTFPAPVVDDATRLLGHVPRSTLTQTSDACLTPPPKIPDRETTSTPVVTKGRIIHICPVPKSTAPPPAAETSGEI